ncbi:hypothetical protein E4U25_003313 [Claviceps purpurea]|nr:hypothetical protein E4U25_003313 [Claviceps purpurea]KAG6312687.1 hypothetical protein E4U44_003128 [Claviceps purpurea]
MPTRGPRDLEASTGSPCRRSPPTLLPGPVAHAVSLATRSTSLAIRLGSFVSYCSLDAARVTTLSSLGLARGFVETILGRAAHDTVTESSSDLTTTEVEKIFERSLESLHSVVTQIVFWTSAGFRFTGTSISSASEASQLLLGSLDKLFGSTDSSRAVASIITLVRRELNNPASGGGEKIGVSDLAVALGVLAYLQGASRRSAVEEARRKSQEEVIWDVVVLSDGERIDVGYGQAEAEQRRQNEFGGPCAPNDDDEAIMERLKDHISSNLDPGTTVSISNSVSSVQTITVDVSGPQLLSLPTPPGAEIVETRGSAERSGKRNSWTLGMDGEASYTVVYRIQRDKLRNTILRGEEDKTGPTVVELVDDATTAMGDTTAPTNPLTPIKPMDSKSSSCESTQARGPPSHSYAQVSTSEPTANQKKQRTPPTEPPRPPARDSSGPASVNRQQALTGSSKRYSPGKKSEVPAAAKTTEKQPRLKRVIKESGQSLSNMWNKEPSYAEPRTPAKQRPHWKGVGGAAASEVASRSKPLTSRPSQPQQPPRQSPPSRRDQTPGSSSRASSRASYVSVHERRRDSVVSQTDSFPRRSKSDTQLSTPTMIRTEFSTQETLSRPSGDSCSPRSPRKTGSHHSQHGQHSQQQQHHNHNNRSSISYAPSLYSLATNDSQSSLISASYYQKSAYNTSGALNVLRNEGFVDGTFPAGHLLPNIARYMRYSSACYGSHFMKLLGISTELPASQVWDGTHPDVRHFAHHTESKHGNILLASFVDPQGGSDATGSTGTGVPLVHYISLDHEAKAVVFACRGTLGFEDVLADLTCDYDDLLWRGRAYRVHKGVHASAKRLLFGGDGRVLVTLKEALLEFPDYGLVLCGHSLGGGVTSLLGVMLSEPNATGPGFVISAEPSTAKHPHYQGQQQQQQQQHRFSNVHLPQGRRIHVYAYGPPGIMSPSLRKLTRGLITTVVHGSDIVPYLSLGVLHDFQFLAQAFKKDDHGTKAEIRHRMWRAFQGHLAEKWHQDSRYPAAPREGDEEWVLPMLQALRGTMKGKRLLPPGEVFVVEMTRVLRRDAFVVQEENGGVGGIGRPARRVVLKYIRDVEGRFMELRFGGGMVTDHSPARYEDALNRLRVGVVE